MLVLGFAWLLLLVVEFTRGLTPFLETLGMVIWIIFILDFLLKFILAPRKLVFLKRNWLTEIALLVPALRVFRIFRVFRVLRAARAVRGLRLVRFVTSLNRGMKALGASLGRRGFGYVVAVTLLVVVSGAAGMYALENDVEGGFENYGEALWWTAMLLTSIGSEYWPQTPEGRVLCVLLSVYGFAVFGYITATLATFFIGRDADRDDAELAGAREIRALHAEILALRGEMESARNDGKENT
ncbi:MAG: ion transporter [Proteobacteria bacterium]|nr:ion transporter [Pseudomonadota bacterium]